MCVIKYNIAQWLFHQYVVDWFLRSFLYLLESNKCIRSSREAGRGFLSEDAIKANLYYSLPLTWNTNKICIRICKLLIRLAKMYQFQSIVKKVSTKMREAPSGSTADANSRLFET